MAYTPMPAIMLELGMFKNELKKFNAIYKDTKKWDDRYIKFKNHSDLTMFVLRWS